MSIDISRLTIDLPRKKHTKVKKAALHMGVSMRELVEMSLDEFLQRKPNKKTEAAIKQAQSRKGLKRFKNMEDLFEDLEN